MKKYLFVLAVATATILGCGKDGEIGPQGPQGEKGEQGIKGVDGTVIHSGTSAPSASIGKVGDYYINLSTRELYGAKTSNGWGNPVSLKGEKGDPGNDGSKIYSGETTPPEDLGKLGDYYFWTQELALFGPKTSSGWGSSLVLGSTQANGVQTFLVTGLRTNYSTMVDYTGSVFNYGSQNITIPGVNLRRGVYFIYSRQKDAFTESRDVTHNNYDDFSWVQINDERTFDNYKFNESYLGDEYRFKNYYYGVTKDAIRIGIIGQADNSPSVSAFKNWLGNATFDILIKYIPEASVTQIQKSGRDIRSLLSVNGR